MATLQLLASAYTCQSGNITVTNPTNAYTDTESDTYATVLNTTSPTEYAYFHGFDFSLIPENAVVTAMEFKIKGQRTYASLRVRLFDKSDGTSLTDGGDQLPTSTPDVITITPQVSISDILALGDDFAFGVGSVGNHEQYVYGMEINVTYKMPPPNKVIYNGNTLIDLTGDTATAEDVALGKLFHLANGEQATGTGGGGGLEYETGTWTSSSGDVNAGSIGYINFSNAHTTPPAFIFFGNTTTRSNPGSSICVWSIMDYKSLAPPFVDPGECFPACVDYVYFSSYEPFNGSMYLDTGADNTGSSGYEYYRYYATNSHFSPRVPGNYYYLYQDVYKWIAIWV